MTEYMLAPKGDFQAEENLVGMFENGKLVAYRVRTNGTTRLVNLLPVASRDRETAEWIYDQFEDGRSVQAIGRELHVSPPTVRRFLEALELTEQIEAGEWDQVWADTHGFAYTEPVVDELTTAGITDVFLGENVERYPGEMVDDVMGNSWHFSKLSADEQTAVRAVGESFS